MSQQKGWQCNITLKSPFQTTWRCCDPWLWRVNWPLFSKEEMSWHVQYGLNSLLQPWSYSTGHRGFFSEGINANFELLQINNANQNGTDMRPQCFHHDASSSSLSQSGHLCQIWRHFKITHSPEWNKRTVRSQWPWNVTSKWESVHAWVQITTGAVAKRFLRVFPGMPCSGNQLMAYNVQICSKQIVSIHAVSSSLQFAFL